MAARVSGVISAKARCRLDRIVSLVRHSGHTAPVSAPDLLEAAICATNIGRAVKMVEKLA